MAADVLCINCHENMALDISLCLEDKKAKTQTLGSLDQRKEQTLPEHSGNLYNIIQDSNSALEGPLCKDCASQLLTGLDQQLVEIELECTKYRKYLESLKSSRIAFCCNPQLFHEKVELMQKKETTLKKELERLVEEHQNLKNELKAQKQRLDDTGKKEIDVYWTKFRDNHRRLLDQEMKEQNEDLMLCYGEVQLERLTSVNVLNKAFHIWTQDDFGTINGFRLGRLLDAPVEWNEINAAWGQISLLFTVLARLVKNFTVEDYEVIALGNHSFVREIKSRNELPLHGYGGFNSVRQSKFDEAMCAFLNCFCQLQRHIENKSQFRMPYRMNNDKDSLSEYKPGHSVKMEYSVKMQFNSEERWTTAMKWMLTNLRWTICYVICDPKMLKL